MGFFCVRFFCLMATDGFAFWKIRSSLPYCQEWETSPLSHCEMIKQPFFYLGRGAQCYAFVSEDGNYVLKFYRHHRAQHPLAFMAPLLPANLKKRLQNTITKRKNKRAKDFASYMIANEQLPEKTGLIYLHLNPTNHLHRTIRIYDKIGVVHHIELDQFVFILQKRAYPIYQTIHTWIKTGEKQRAKEGIAQLIALLAYRAENGIYDKDPDLKTNFGFTSEGPIQFDIGRYKMDPSRSQKPTYKEDLIRITDKLCRWLEKKDPSLSTFVKEEIEKL